ncbi:hypothetical protein EMCRGX_G005672 [Ephydatia muelleri]
MPSALCNPSQSMPSALRNPPQLMSSTLRNPPQSALPHSITPASTERLSPCSGSSTSQLHPMFGGGRLLFGMKNKRLVKRARREWTHTFFCLSEVDADTVPTLSERTALQLQGLGEKQFPLPLDADALVLDETLKREFPPLSDGGGYDLLTKEEGSSKHLNLRCTSGLYKNTLEQIRRPHGVSQSAPRTDQPAPLTDQPAPCTTQPAPRTTQPAPCTTQPAPFTTQPAPCTTQPAPRTDQPAPRTTQPAPRTTQPAPRYPTSSTYYPTSSTYYPTSSTYYPTSSTYYPTSSTYYPTSSTYYPTSSTYYPTSSTYYPTSSTYYPTSSMYYPTSSTYYPTNPMYYATSSTYYPTTSLRRPSPLPPPIRPPPTHRVVLTPQLHADHIQILDDHQDDDDDASGSQLLTPQPHVDHIQISDDNEDDDDASGSEEMSTKDIVMNLKHGITEERWELSVLSVQFQVEAGVDVGGLSREFFTLLMDEIRQHFWKKGTLIHNSKALKDGVYLKLGQLIAMAVVHSEIHTNLMGKPVYEYLSGRSLCSLKLQNITDEEQMHNFQIEHYEFLVEAGVMSTTLADKTSNLNELCLHSAILRSVAEIQQLAAGLKTLCVIDALEMYPSLMESYFIKSETAMTAAELRSTFIVTYSEDVDVRLKEEIALTYFDEYMEKCAAVDGGKMSSCEEQPGRRITLETIKRFFCGSDYIPVPSRPHLIFTSSTYLSASTCAVQLCIPYVHNSFDAFELCINEALLYYGGFGVT